MAFLQEVPGTRRPAGVDQLGYYLPPFAYADLQVLGQAVEGTKSLDQDKLADYMRSHTFNTIAGDIKFGPNGEWTEPRVLAVQFQGVKGNGLDQFKNRQSGGGAVAAGLEIRRTALSLSGCKALTTA